MTGAEVLEYLRELNLVSLILRFIMAAACGGLIGATRGRGQHAAGLRTHLLVCIGAASVVMVSQFYAVNMGMGGDSMRMPAQVISGIGFLGAGSIIVTGKHHVTGLTTAAGLWASACMGIACGAGFYECAMIMFLLIYFTLVKLYKIDTARVKNCRRVTLFVEMEKSQRLSVLMSGLQAVGLEIASIEHFGQAGEDFCGYMADVEINGGVIVCEDVLERIKQIPGVSFAAELKT